MTQTAMMLAASTSGNQAPLGTCKSTQYQELCFHSTALRLLIHYGAVLSLLRTVHQAPN